MTGFEEEIDKLDKMFNDWGKNEKEGKGKIKIIKKCKKCDVEYQENFENGLCSKCNEEFKHIDDELAKIGLKRGKVVGVIQSSGWNDRHK